MDKLTEAATVKEYLTVQIAGERQVKRSVRFELEALDNLEKKLKEKRIADEYS